MLARERSWTDKYVTQCVAVTVAVTHVNATSSVCCNDPVGVTCPAAALANPSDIAAHSSPPLVARPDNASVGTDKATRVPYDSIVSAPALWVVTQDR
jgi:hypothetical protein